MSKITVKSAEEVVNELKTQSHELLEQAKQLEKSLRMARGTQQNVVGDDGPTSELMRTIHTLLKERPMTFRELLDTTGARDNRIKGVIMRLQREGTTVVNLGTDVKALWFCPTPEVLVRLKRVMKR